MEFERKIYKEILRWKQLNTVGNKTALVIKGPRQVGKTTIVKFFSEREYENVVYINFMNETKYNICFEKDLDVNYITSQLAFKNDNFKFIPGKTVIIFDEIQEFGRARSSIKAFCEDGRFDVIATGSLLGVLGYNRSVKASIPVGFETHLTMHSLDFEEFLWAIGVSKDKIDYLKDKLNNLSPIEQPIHERFLEEYKKYLFVGGMPKAIKTHLQTNDIKEVRKVQQSIIDTYRNDFGKHLNTREQLVTNNWDYAKLNRVYQSIPEQIARQEKEDNSSTKFKFKDVSSGSKFRDYADAIQWLSDAGIVNVCYNVKKIQEPLLSYKIYNNFKIYMNDTGLFMSTLPLSIVDAINDSRIDDYKGYIYENLIADQLVKNNQSLYFFATKESEVDFIVSTRKQLLLLEVKAKQGSSQSIINKSKIAKIKAIKLSANNIGIANGILTMPYYLSFLINEDFEFPRN